MQSSDESIDALGYEVNKRKRLDNNEDPMSKWESSIDECNKKYSGKEDNKGSPIIDLNLLMIYPLGQLLRNKAEPPKPQDIEAAKLKRFIADSTVPDSTAPDSTAPDSTVLRVYKGINSLRGKLAFLQKDDAFILLNDLISRIKLQKTNLHGLEIDAIIKWLEMPTPNMLFDTCVNRFNELTEKPAPELDVVWMWKTLLSVAHKEKGGGLVQRLFQNQVLQIIFKRAFCALVRILAYGNYNHELQDGVCKTLIHIYEREEAKFPEDALRGVFISHFTTPDNEPTLHKKICRAAVLKLIKYENKEDACKLLSFMRDYSDMDCIYDDIESFEECARGFYELTEKLAPECKRSVFCMWRTLVLVAHKDNQVHIDARLYDCPDVTFKRVFCALVRILAYGDAELSSSVDVLNTLIRIYEHVHRYVDQNPKISNLTRIFTTPDVMVTQDLPHAVVGAHAEICRAAVLELLKFENNKEHVYILLSFMHQYSDMRCIYENSDKRAEILNSLTGKFEDLNSKMNDNLKSDSFKSNSYNCCIQLVICAIRLYYAVYPPTDFVSRMHTPKDVAIIYNLMYAPVAPKDLANISKHKFALNKISLEQEKTVEKIEILVKYLYIRAPCFDKIASLLGETLENEKAISLYLISSIIQNMVQINRAFYFFDIFVKRYDIFGGPLLYTRSQMTRYDWALAYLIYARSGGSNDNPEIYTQIVDEMQLSKGTGFYTFLNDFKMDEYRVWVEDLNKIADTHTYLQIRYPKVSSTTHVDAKCMQILRLHEVSTKNVERACFDELVNLGIVSNVSNARTEAINFALHNSFAVDDYADALLNTLLDVRAPKWKRNEKLYKDNSFFMRYVKHGWGQLHDDMAWEDLIKLRRYAECSEATHLRMRCVFNCLRHARYACVETFVDKKFQL